MASENNFIMYTFQFQLTFESLIVGYFKCMLQLVYDGIDKLI